MADFNLADMTDNTESCFDDKKRKADDTLLENCKKIKVNSSLGLTLLQAYDEEDFPDDDVDCDKEDSPKDSFVASKDLVTGKIFSGPEETLTCQNLSSFIVEEEEIGPNASPEENERLESENSNPHDKVEYLKEGLTQSNDDEMNIDVNKVLEAMHEKEQQSKICSAGNTESEKSVVISDKKENNAIEEIVMSKSQNESLADLSASKCEADNGIVSNVKLLNECEDPEIMHKTVWKNMPISAEYNFSIFGKAGNFDNGSANCINKLESKPTKKVKLNRSKFVKSADVSNNDTKLLSGELKRSPIKNSPPSSNRDSASYTKDLALSSSMPQSDVISCTFINNKEKTCELLSMFNEEDSSEILIASKEEKSCNIPVAPETSEFYGTSKERESLEILGDKYEKTSKCPVTVGRENVHEFLALTNEVIPQIPMTADYESITHVHVTTRESKTLDPATVQHNDQKSVFCMTENEPVVQNLNIDNSSPNFVEIPRKEEEKSSKMFAIENEETSKTPVVSDEKNDTKLPVLTPQIPMNANYKDIIYIPVAIDNPKTPMSDTGQDNDQKSLFLKTENELVVQDLNIDNNHSNIEILRKEEEKSSEILAVKNGETPKSSVVYDEENYLEFSASANEVTPQIPINTNYENIIHIPVTTSESRTQNSANSQHGDQKSTFLITTNELVVHDINEPNLVENPKKEEEQSSNIFAGKYEETSKNLIRSDEKSGFELSALTKEIVVSQIPVNADYEEIIHIPIITEEPKTLNSATSQDNDQKSLFLKTENELVVQDLNIDNNQSNIVEILRKEEEKSSKMFAAENEETSKFPVLSDKENDLEFSALDNEIVAPQIPMNTDYEDIINVSTTPDEPKTPNLTTDQHNDQKSVCLIYKSEPVIQDINIEDSQPNLAEISGKEMTESSGVPTVPSSVVEEMEEMTSANHMKTVEQVSVAVAEETEFSEVCEFLANDFTETKQSSTIEEMEEEKHQEVENLSQNYVDTITTGQRNENKRDINEELTEDIIQSDGIFEGVQEKLIQKEAVNLITKEDVQTMSVFREETPNALKTLYSKDEELDNLSNEEEIFEDAIDTTAENVSTKAQQISDFPGEVNVNPVSEMTEHQPASLKISKELSKLEQALTGRLENFHCTKKLELTLPKEDAFISKSPMETIESNDNKQNIKLHLSVHGDRVSIKSSQPAANNPPTRIKRQYRKRVKDPNNLEENKARAKEYTHRLRTRTERETPGVKKQIRKKRRSMHLSTKDSLENDSKDKSKSQDEFLVKQELQDELEAKRRSENLLEVKRKYEFDIKQKIRDELEVKRTLKDNHELQRKFQQESKTKRKSHDGSKVKRKQKDDLKVRRKPRNESESPVAVNINLAESTNTSVGKVQPIKLKISKNANVTIECTPTYGPATIEKIGGAQKVEVNEKIVGILEDARKDASTSNYMEQAGRTWSGPDLQRVERLLKDTNITITPVMSSRDNSSQPSSVLKPILTAVKDKSGNQKATPQSPTITAATIIPISNKDVMEMDDSSSDSRNLNVTMKPFDLEDEIHHWKISKPSNEFDITSISSPFTSLNKSVDVKSEIRKKIASAEKYKSDINEFDIQVTCELPLKAAKKLPNLLPIESPTQEQVTSISTSKPVSIPASEELTLPKCASMSVPASVPVSLSASLSTSAFMSNLPAPSSLAPPSEFASAALSVPLPTTAVSVPAPMLMSTTASVQSPVSAILQANNLTMKDVTKLEPQLVNASTVELLRFPSVHSSPSLPTDLFPKKRGRPTKAMVAAREAYRQHQEELDRLRMQQIRSETEIHREDLSPPITLQKEPKQSETPENVTPNESNKSRRGRKPKGERAEKKDSDDLSATDDRLMDPEREAEEMKRLEEERARKDEERERKNELRRQKARERSDLVKAKRLRQKMKAQERQKMAQELRRLQMEEKKKLQEQLKRLPQSISGFDDDTRMSAENSHVTNMSFGIGIVDEDSSGATNDTSQKAKKSRLEVPDADSQDLLVNQIAEYQWPIQGGELYMIQEQVSNFLGVKSFKRKYPDIKRRPVDSEERAYLVDSGLVSETLCDLGITAVCSAEVLDIMCSDFPEKYEEFRRYMRDKQIKELSFKQKAWANGLGYKLLMADGTKQDLKKRAMESASNWNSALNKSRSDNRRCHMDLQTFIVHYPKTKGFKMSIPTPKIGSYPISILPGQFCDYYKEYTSNELRYMPVNTVLYGPLKQPNIHNGDGSQTDSDDSSSSDESSSTTSEDTQATEDTIEDMEKDMSLDETTDKMLVSNDTMFLDDKDQVQRNILNGRRESIVNERSMKALCKVCLGDQLRNKMNIPEVLITCSQCASTNHPTCLDLSLNVVPQLKTYDWQCPDCKSCARCKDNTDEDKMLFCDTCDRGYHIYCVGLKKVPSGNWQCQECTLVEANVCSSGICKEESGLIEITS